MASSYEDGGGGKPYVDKVHFNVSDGVTDLTIGAPGPDILAKSRTILKRAAEKRLSRTDEDDLELLQYGVEEGPTSFLFNLAKLLTEGYAYGVGRPVPVEELMLTSGASAGLTLIVNILMDSNCVVFVESPTYFLVLKMLKDLGITNDRIVPVPMDADGMDVEYLEQKVQDQHYRSDVCSADRYWGFVYSVPTFHNPTGACLSSSKARKLVSLSRQYNFLIVCDDVYNLLYYYDVETARPPKRLLRYDREHIGRRSVISNGSFSKILAPGVRLGWFETSPQIKSRLMSCGLLDSGGSLNAVMAGIVGTAMELGLMARHIKTLRMTYKQRMDAVCEVLRKGLPDTFEVRNPGGGYFVWVTGPHDQGCDSFDAKRFAHLCSSKYGVEFLPGEKCSSLKASATALRRDGIPSQDRRMACVNSFRRSFGIGHLVQTFPIRCRVERARFSSSLPHL